MTTPFQDPVPATLGEMPRRQPRKDRIHAVFRRWEKALQAYEKAMDEALRLVEQAEKAAFTASRDADQAAHRFWRERRNNKAGGEDLDEAFELGILYRDFIAAEADAQNRFAALDDAWERSLGVRAEAQERYAKARDAALRALGWRQND